MNLSRRAAIRLALALGSASIAGSQKKIYAQEQGNNANLRQSVLVIGAGIAGIAAALELQNSGYQVTILEGRERAGGRIHTKQFGGTSVDLGAAWIHGDSPSNPIIKLANKYELETYVTDWDETWLFEKDEGVIEDSEYDRIEKLAEEVIEKIHLQQESAINSESMEQVVATLVASLVNSKNIKDGVRWWLSSEVEAVSAANYRDLSLKYWDEDEAFAGEDLLIKKGYSQLIAKMTTGINIKFNHAVTQISYTDSDFTASGPWGELKADKGLVTVPLGVLQKNSIQFNPPLPELKMDSISRLSMGVLNKIVLTFEKAFWPKEAHRLGLLASRADERIEYYPLPPGGKSPILIGLVYGDYARRIERLDKQELANVITKQLQQMFPDVTLLNLVDIQITGWDSDPMSRGSYSHIPPSASLSDCKVLGEQVGHSLFFAGEATHPLYLGTVHGAYLSGLRAVKEIKENFSAS